MEMNDCVIIAAGSWPGMTPAASVVVALKPGDQRAGSSSKAAQCAGRTARPEVPVVDRRDVGGA